LNAFTKNTKTSQFNKDYIKDKGYHKNLNNQLSLVFAGKLNYLQMVKGKENPTFKKLKKRFDKLESVSSVGSLPN